MKFTLIFMMTFTALFLGGCTDLPKEQEEAIPVPEETSFDIISESLQDGTLTIQYPQLSPVKDERIEKINQIIYEDVRLFIKQYSDPETSLEMDYEMMLHNDEMLSILYTGDYSVFGGMYPSHFLFTTNIDMKTGEKVKLSDRVVIDEDFVEKFKQASYIDWQHEYGEKQAAVTEYVFSQDLKEILKHADTPSFIKNPYGVYSYYTEDFFIISIQVPHALGDHAEFKLPLEDA